MANDRLIRIEPGRTCVLRHYRNGVLFKTYRDVLSEATSVRESQLIGREPCEEPDWTKLEADVLFLMHQYTCTETGDNMSCILRVLNVPMNRKSRRASKSRK